MELTLRDGKGCECSQSGRLGVQFGTGKFDISRDFQVKTFKTFKGPWT